MDRGRRCVGIAGHKIPLVLAHKVALAVTCLFAEVNPAPPTDVMVTYRRSMAPPSVTIAR